MSRTEVADPEDDRGNALAQPFQNISPAGQTWPDRLVQKLMPARARMAVALFWVVLSLAGLGLAKSFVKVLATEVPPSPGTPSKLAFDVFDEYFPAQPLSGAVYIQSSDGSKLVDFVNRSTCTLSQPSPGMSGKTLIVSMSCQNISALGQGCMRSSDMEKQILAEAAQLLPMLLDNQTKVNATLLMLARYMQGSLPNITHCPERTPLTDGWLGYINGMAGKLKAKYPKYDVEGQSLSVIPNQTIQKSVSLDALGDMGKAAEHKLKNLTGQDINAVNISISLPAGQFWQLFQDHFLADELSSSLASVSTSDPSSAEQIIPTSPLATDIGLALDDIASDAPPAYIAKATSLGSMFFYIKQGINTTMDMSAKTVPVALLILALMVRNFRLLLVVIPNLIFSIACAILFMYPYASSVTTSTTAPSLMIAVDLAMSIDYSLFLLTRFDKEIKAGQSVPEAVAIMLRTSGRIVLVSGVTLLLCFLMMLVLPVSFIYSMGVSAAMTVLFAVCVSLTFTPVMLLSFPKFFSNSKRWGLSFEDCCCGSASASSLSLSDEQSLRRHPSQDEQDARPAPENAVMSKRSCWPGFGSQIQKGAWVVAIVLVAIMIPVAVTSLPKFQHSVGLLPMMPTDSSATHNLIELQNSFGVGAVFPTQLILVAPPGSTSTDSNLTQWLQGTCDQLALIAEHVNSKMDSLQQAFTSKAFSGAMILNGRCQTTPGPGKWNTGGVSHTATLVMISYPIDPFSTQGQKWIAALREAIDTPSAKAVASWYVYGTGPVQIDASQATFDRFTIMVALMMCVVFVVIALSFKSFVAPARAVFCLLWMLVITYGLAIFTYQDGLLSFLNWSQLGKRESGAMSWLSPAMAGAMMVGLGLDYDIFYSERVVEEWEHGYDEKESAVRALGATANTISAAGLIMVVAFAALLVSETPCLNEIAFLLTVSIIIDCFITTKIIIPCAMALLSRSNFWPRKQPGLPAREQVSLPLSANSE